MKVGILTFHASHNYGSMLQAFAMQTTLRKLGVDSYIVNFRSDVQKSLIPPPVQMAHPRSSLMKLLREPLKTMALIRKYQRFENFLNHDLRVTEELTSEADVAKHIQDNNYDVIIAGSDQIWNPACWDFSTAYLCDFPYNGKRVSYAPSMGSHPENITDENIEQILKLISDFNAISTREKRGSDFISRKIGKEVNVVIDPTLLLTADDYIPISQDNNIGKKYIFYYTPREEKGTFASAIKLSEKLGLDIVVTQDFEEYNGHDNVIHKLDCGPKEFLSLIRNASYCIGNSFHLLAFSLIFHKEFILLSPEADSRMMNLLEPMSLTERLVKPNQDFKIPEKIDYASVESVLNSIKKNSLAFLRNSLEIEK